MSAGTHAERIVSLLARKPGLDDDQIAAELGIEPRQTVNQTCRRLAAKGVLNRRRGDRGKIINALSSGPVAPPAAGSATSSPPQFSRPVFPRGPTEAFGGSTLVPADLARTLIVLPCSDAKRECSSAGAEGDGIERHLPQELAEELRQARQQIKTRVGFSEDVLVAAWQRYDGTLYQTARPALAGLIEAGAHIVILSGGYGVVLASEPIGTYNTVLKPGWWPDRILERVLVAYARHHELSSVRAFASATSAYRQVLQRVRWSGEGIGERLLLLPEAKPGGLVKSPATVGEALIALHAGTLTTGWRSSYGLGLTVLRQG